MSGPADRQVQTTNPPNVPAPPPTFSQVASYTFPANSGSKIVCVSGQVGLTPDGKTESTFEDQVRMALKNVENCLAAVGASKRDIMKVTHYVVDFNFTTRSPGAVYTEWIGEHRPASTLVPVQRLPVDEWFYEIETLAIVPAG